MTKPFLRFLIEEQAEIRPEQNFLTFENRLFSYSGIDQDSNRVANSLLSLGIKPGDRIVVFLGNGPEFIFCWFATIKLNVTMVPVNIQLKGEGLRYILKHSEPHAVITSQNLLPQINSVSDILPAKCPVIVVGAGKSPALLLDSAITGYDTYNFEKLLLQSSFDRPPDVLIREEDTAIIIYTSGTTGYPKGVMVSRRAQTNHPLYYHPELLRTSPDQTAYNYLPLFHVTSQGVTMGSFIGGARMALDSEFNVFGFWERIRRHNAVTFPYLGAVISMLYARPPRADDAEHPATHALGAAASKEIWSGFERRFGVQLFETYGQSEWVAIWTKNPDYAVKIGSAGKAPERAEVKIVDQKGRVLPPNTLGEIILRPSEPGMMMSGYFKQSELNDRVFKDGWYFTGDVGEMDSDGYLYFRGRLKDYIRRRGENISAFEIERVVNMHPSVLESAAVGVPSELSEEEVKLCVVLKPDEQKTEEEIWRYCKENLPSFMVPRFIQLLPNLPHTPTQRVRKFMLAENGTGDAWDRKTYRKAAVQE